MKMPSGESVPAAGSISRPWLWQVWAVVIALFLVTLGVHVMLPPALAITSPTLSFLGDNCTVRFCATDHTGQPTTAKLVVIVGIGVPSSGHSPGAYSEYARKTVPLRLAPRESREFSCEFPVPGRPLPNTAQIEVLR